MQMEKEKREFCPMSDLQFLTDLQFLNLNYPNASNFSQMLEKKMEMKEKEKRKPRPLSNLQLSSLNFRRGKSYNLSQKFLTPLRGMQTHRRPRCTPGFRGGLCNVWPWIPEGEGERSTFEARPIRKETPKLYKKDSCVRPKRQR
jgi:hypothetical protein